MTNSQQDHQTIRPWHDWYLEFDSQARSSQPKCRDVHEYAGLLDKLQREKLAAFDKSYAAKQADWRELIEEMEMDDPRSIRRLLRGDATAGALAWAERGQYSKDREKLQRSMARRTLHDHLREFAQGIQPGLSWEDIEIRILDDFRFQAIVRGESQEPVGFAAFGLKDTRGGGAKPNEVWTFFTALPSFCGTEIQSAKKQRVQKLAQKLRGALRSHFNIPDDPIPFVKGSGYQAKFRFIPQPPTR